MGNFANSSWISDAKSGQNLEIEKMKFWIFAVNVMIASIAIVTAYSLDRRNVRLLSTPQNSDQCLGCVDDIIGAIDHCKDAQNHTLECVEWALGAAVECIECVCDVIDIIDGGDGICPGQGEEKL